MAIYRSPDSLSSCNDLYAYSDKLQISRRPDLKPSPILSKDTITSLSFSKEALERLERPSRGVITQHSVIFKRIGKYVFLSVALPPYFLLYGLPKWLLVEGFAWLTFSFSWLAKKITQTLQKPFDIFIQKMNQMVFFVQMMTQRILQPVAKLGVQIRQFFYHLNTRVQQPIQLFAKGLKRALKKPGALLVSFAKNIKNQVANIREKIGQTLYSIHERVQDGLEWVKQVSPKVLEWGAASLQVLREKQLTWQEKVAAKLQFSSKAATVCMNWLNKHAGVVASLVKTSLKPIEYVFYKAVKPAFDFVSRKLQVASSKMSGFLNDRRKRALVFLQGIQAKIKSWTPQGAFDRFLPASFLAKLPKLIRRILVAIKKNPVTYAVFHAGFKVVTFLLMNSVKVMEKRIQGTSNILQSIASKLGQLKKQAGHSCHSLVGATAGAFSKIKQGGAKGLHGSLVGLFMVGILLGWGCQAVSETTARWIEKMSFRKSNSNS